MLLAGAKQVGGIAWRLVNSSDEARLCFLFLQRFLEPNPAFCPLTRGPASPATRDAPTLQACKYPWRHPGSATDTTQGAREQGDEGPCLLLRRTKDARTRSEDRYFVWLTHLPVQRPLPCLCFLYRFSAALLPACLPTCLPASDERVIVDEPDNSMIGETGDDPSRGSTSEQGTESTLAHDKSTAHCFRLIRDWRGE